MDNFFNYSKNNNDLLFKSFNESHILIEKPQNYIPIYNLFFEINKTNFNNFNLELSNTLHNIISAHSYSSFNVELINNNNDKVVKTDCFFKYSPLIDPCKYLAGKFKGNDLYELPKLNNTAIDNFTRTNNFAYVDSIFSFLSSVLLNKFNFIHGLDFYGSYLGIKNNFKYNIIDDLDYLENNDYFNENLNKDFKIINMEKHNIFKNLSKKNKLKLDINDDLINIDFDNINELNNINDVIVSETESNLIKENLDLIYNSTLSKSKTNSSSSSSCSSRTSNTLSTSFNDDELENNDKDHDNNSLCTDLDSDSDDDYTENSSASDDIDDDIYVNINKFPVCAICLEKCDNTLDYLLEEDMLNNNELASCFFQIIMTLLVYQNVFSFTHNDLHTNNIMFIHTDKPYLYYFYKNRHYKVPTYNKIYKIIDFGRSVYSINNKIVMSDCFAKDGDAATQFNCLPYYNDKKKKIEPNYSFDLCRLGCSLFDFFSDDLENIKKIKNTKDNKLYVQLIKMISDWCLDDNNKNILYKKNGDERYPNFKLYKMITRTVHRWTPESEIERELFNSFIVNRKKIQKKATIMNIDKFFLIFNKKK